MYLTVVWFTQFSLSSSSFYTSCIIYDVSHWHRYLTWWCAYLDYRLHSRVVLCPQRMSPGREMKWMISSCSWKHLKGKRRKSLHSLASLLDQFLVGETWISSKLCTASTSHLSLITGVLVLLAADASFLFRSDPLSYNLTRKLEQQWWQR